MDKVAERKLADLIEQPIRGNRQGGVGFAERNIGSNDMVALKTDPSVSYGDLLASLSVLPGFRYLEPDFIVHADSTIPSDPLVPECTAWKNRSVRRLGFGYR